VVDDDPLVLTLLKTVLQRAGFEVWSAPGGLAGVDLFKRHRERIDVVLLDVCMPGLDGPQTLAELRAVDQLVPCCFMSGYMGEYTPADLEEMGALRFFEKPFRTHEMAQELYRIARQPWRRSA
jgi:DNA-binding response OmpR family regulator